MTYYPYVGIDPGETAGVACLDKNGELIRLEQYKEAELDEFMASLDVKLGPITFIVEDYRIFGHKVVAHIGKPLKTAEQIGAIKRFCRSNGIECVVQASRILPTAIKWSGIVMPKTHSQTHKWSAYLHAYYYLHLKGVIKARVLEQK